AVAGAGAPVAVTLTNVTFGEIDAAKAPVSGGCTATVSSAKLEGTITAVTGGGGGGGAGPAPVGDGGQPIELARSEARTSVLGPKEPLRGDGASSSSATRRRPV